MGRNNGKELEDIKFWAANLVKRCNAVFNLIIGGRYDEAAGEISGQIEVYEGPFGRIDEVGLMESIGRDVIRGREWEWCVKEVMGSKPELIISAFWRSPSIRFDLLE